MNNYSECPLSYGLRVKELELLTLNPPSGTVRYKRAMQSNPAQEGTGIHDDGDSECEKVSRQNFLSA